ncbi:TIM22 inner membrane protein import complex subunit Tim54 [Schizosaccharomyces japonicus yFS275]|uniref:Mitochondrial import inner membrane translocase subunit TIM54 n=1 Tax=Schizosaccharomyces japonicus (strain yFS275 / FY16936) TaxID=402676 RepID=B6JVJ3_SCHJY|nr:TIM22 inner membrane protein import complex subunit Tim54 [Schizosaccharomyces japonicus yFS275]EEB05394.1 TIM22 inner membrane protein import complex subunit Tim54 [Schizosaccharomyces japonicus yFS275]
MFKRIKSYLPGRNMSIFLGTVAAFTGAVYYDKREQKKILNHYCNKVAFLADQPMQPLEMPRRFRVYLHGPPGDGIYVARDEFHRYVKPILNAAAVDFDMYESKGEGELTRFVAREVWNKHHNISDEPQNVVAIQSLLKQSDEPSATVLLGRHAVKEFVQGCSLGCSPSYEEFVAKTTPPEKPVKADESNETKVPNTSEDNKDTDTKTATADEEEDGDESKTPDPMFDKSFIPKDIQAADKTATENILLVPLPHLLGFSNTFRRIYRFLHRRELANKIGELVTNAILEQRTVPIQKATNEQLLDAEEGDWPKMFTKREDANERVWTGPFMKTDDKALEDVKLYVTPLDSFTDQTN